MLRTHCVFTCICALLLSFPLLAADDSYTYSGPYDKNNLTVFLIHGPQTLADKNVLTLSEAMAKKSVNVYETGNVQQLAIENRGQDPVYIQAGDIVKGGRQDRVFSKDMLLQAHSGKVPIDSFCVENGRWRQRGTENALEFTSSSKQLVSKEQKLAAKLYKDQGKVWSEVDKLQNKINQSLKTESRSKQSETSLQLTLENKQLNAKVTEFELALKGIPSDKTDALGYVYAVNGEFSTGDIYANHGLFVKLWPKLLQAAATEAVTGLSKTPAQAKTLGVADVKSWFEHADRAKPKKESVDKHTAIYTQEAKHNVRFDTVDERQKTLIHRNYLSKQ